MLMLCWFYCIPFAKLFYFSTAAFLVVAGLFMLRRGIYRHRAGLRTAAFWMMGFASFKAFVLDIWVGKKYLLCAYAPSRNINIPLFGCDRQGLMALDIFGFCLFAVSAFLLTRMYRAYRHVTRAPLTPDQLYLPFWVRSSSVMLIVMIIWLSAPWVGFLTVGHVPPVFASVPWQLFAVVNALLLLNGFWRAACCVWVQSVHRKAEAHHLHNTWNPRDTLWLNVFLYLIALALSYVSHDILRPR